VKADIRINDEIEIKITLLPILSTTNPNIGLNPAEM